MLVNVKRSGKRSSFTITASGLIYFCTHRRGTRLVRIQKRQPRVRQVYVSGEGVRLPTRAVEVNKVLLHDGKAGYPDPRASPWPSRRQEG